MGAQAPQWLLTSFVDAMQQIGATASRHRPRTRGRPALAERWSAPEPAVAQPASAHEHADTTSTRSPRPRTTPTSCASPRGTTARSSTRPSRSSSAGSRRTSPATRCIDHAHNRLTNLGVPEGVVARVDELIAFLTRHRAPRTDFDAQVLARRRPGSPVAQPAGLQEAAVLTARRAQRARRPAIRQGPHGARSSRSCSAYENHLPVPAAAPPGRTPPARTSRSN